jgi:type VI secretion system protein ImpH
MAPHQRHTKASIISALPKEADQFEFHAIVKLLENIQKEATPLGEGVDPLEEPLRLQARVTQEFPSTEIHQLLMPDDKKVSPLLTTNFLGIAGNNGPLPDPYTNHIIQRSLKGDNALRDFLDIFNHRILSLLHRIRKKFWVGVSVSAPETTLLGKCLRSLLGLALPQTQNRLGIPDRSLTYYAGLLWQKPRSAQGLEVLLREFFKTPARVYPLQGKWVQVPLHQQSILGAQHHALGQSSFIGPRYWDQSAYFKVSLGPMPLSTYIDFLKVGPSFQELKTLIAYYAGKDQDFRLNLRVKGNEVPKARLGHGVALGWTSWLNRGNDNKQDDGQCLLNTKSIQKIYHKSP